MLLEMLQHINVLDVLFVLMLIRVINISIQKGFFIESFKLLGTFLATYIGLHYYTHFADRIKGVFILRSAPIEFVDFVAFLLLVALGYNFILILRIVFIKTRTDEALRAASRWAAMPLGVARGILLSGLIAFGLSISSLSLFSDMVAQSMLGNSLVNASTAVYEWTWENVAKNISAGEQLNETVEEVRKSLRRDFDEDEDGEIEPVEPRVIEVETGI